MERTLLHPSGPEFSRFITGAWRWDNLSAEAIDSLINQSLDCGITTFDHADIYGNYTCEALFGKVIRERPSLRSGLQLVTKCGIKLLSDKKPAHWIKHYDTSKEHIIQSVETSLKNLHTDYLDLLLIHRPDPLLNPQEVAETFSQLKQSGKVLHFGVSNFKSAQLEMFQQYVPDPLVTNQIELSLFNNTHFFDGTVDTLMKHRISPMAWSPLGGGKHFTAYGQQEAVESRLEMLVVKYQCTVSQLLLAWLLNHPSGIVPILGTTKPHRIKEGAHALAVKLDRQDWFAMLKLVTGNDVA